MQHQGRNALFGEDYPYGKPPEDTFGRLNRTIDGDDFGARFVVGRNVAEGADEALPAEALDAIAEAITGSPASLLPQSALDVTWVGRCTTNTRADRKASVSPKS